MNDDRAYFNSTRLHGRELAGYEIKAKSQNEKTLEFLEHNPDLVVTSEDINRLVMPDAPETSPRRALTWLKVHGYVEKVGKIEGQYGRPIYQWRLRRRDREPEQQALSL
jgi:hypothetical protein